MGFNPLGIRVSDSNRIQVGTRVKVLQPAYVAHRTGVILSKEELPDGKITGRWIIQIEGENILLSLMPQEFAVIE
jgi:hypothetical protein